MAITVKPCYLFISLVVRLLPGAVLGCEDDLYKNCKERAEAGDCEVIFIDIDLKCRYEYFLYQPQNIILQGDRYSDVTAYETTLTMLSECRKSCQVGLKYISHS